MPKGREGEEDSASDADGARPDPMAKFDGSTGSAPVTDETRARAQRARLLFLATNFVILLVNALAGRVVYHQTNSLTMEIDFVTFGIDLFALGVNMVVEVSKGRAASARGVFILDLIGCFISLGLLILVAIWGLLQSMHREQLAERGGPMAMRADEVDHVGTMFIYSLFSLALSFATMSIFWSRKDVMYPDGFGEEDRLNTVSSLAHTVVDFVGTLAVFGTSATMIHEETQGSGRWQRFEDVVQADIHGSLLICFVVVLCSAVLIREAYKSTSKIACPVQEDNAEEGVAAASRAAPTYNTA
mmetsp:Transcript_5052/g.12382  ORF Transcript_5052/g.12382 Transcript_5052/m.12382 type:complete len:301 (-) Transcript_5052:41-943(-)|eukprot:CAMPEP_0115454096 /NCGR_PEP_ID=MMETSP0271-20121206/43460_1 /TAXON_ID=71861 /ORGANISM="Scrippsiella trochoidea, Strain CCMP3099" /LENGTH=300 /DNA_ID=CAMNT_0002880497 /DNA_START=216 /DNA_END=1118 /DNA_ORIENTATION=+